MADLVIRGMEMPENCGDCYFCDDWAKCQLLNLNNIFDYCKDGIERPVKCPLVPLPEGHGDLIEKKLANARFCQFCFWKHQNEDACERCAGCPIDFIPTIVPAEGGGEDV